MENAARIRQVYTGVNRKNKVVVVDDGILDLNNKELAQDKIMTKLDNARDRGLNNNKFYQFLNKRVSFVPKDRSLPTDTESATNQYRKDNVKNINERGMIYFSLDNDFKQINSDNLRRFREREKADETLFKKLDARVATNMKEVMDEIKQGQMNIMKQKYTLKGQFTTTNGVNHARC